MTSDVLRRPATRVWLALVAATLFSWAMAEHAASARVAATSVILIAAFKVRLVIVHFMELDWKPYPWRVLLECWTVGSAVLIIGGYWLMRA